LSKGSRGIAAGALVLAAFVAASGVAGAATKPLVVGFADDAGKYLDATSDPAAAPPAPTGPAPPKDDSQPADPASTPSIDPPVIMDRSSPRVSDFDPPVRRDLTRAAFFSELVAIGATANRMTVLWDPARPLAIPQRTSLDAAAITATTRGVDVILSVRAEKAAALTASPARPAQFAAFLATLARAYPQVRTFVVGNEPNQPRFWQPQFAGSRRVAAAAYERVLALSYEALKRVDSRIQVVGAGLSSRGNDDSSAPNNRSTSPVRFIHDLGVAYRKSGRTRPIMDALGFHPCPRWSKDSLERGLDWPNAA